jgi:hypothetical protein
MATIEVRMERRAKGLFMVVILELRLLRKLHLRNPEMQG